MVEREEDGFLPTTSVQDTPSHQVEKTSGGAQNAEEEPSILVTVSAESLHTQLSSTRADSKEGIDELCPVCGDKVSGYHYGLLTCESCKGFFKRTVQNKKMYTCVAERTCHIDKSQRKRCPYCRFQKCLEVGMKLEAVRADRMRGGRNKFGPMYKRERARKMQMMRQKQIVLCGGEGSSSAVVSTTPPPSLASFAGTLSLSYSTAASPGGVKQELIQIPQLSSSTSSPESSPPFASPGSGTTSSSDQQKPPLWPPVTQYEAGSTTTAVSALTPHPLVTAKVCSPLIQELQMALVDDKEWQTQLFSLLHSQTYNQCEVDTFELLCKVVDQCLFTQVDWARNSIYFKELKVDDQMKLLQNSWSDLLLLDHIHQRLHLGLPDETTMPNGQKFDLMSLALLGLPSMADQLLRLMGNLQILKFDPIEYICLKFLLLLNPEVKNLNNLKLVQEAYDQAQQALLDYTLAAYPQITDKFRLMMMHINEMRAIGAKGEEYLYFKHINGNAPSQTLLMEMLHARKK